MIRLRELESAAHPHSSNHIAGARFVLVRVVEGFVPKGNRVPGREFFLYLGDRLPDRQVAQ